MLTQDDAAKLALSGYSKSDIEALGFSFTPTANNNESNKPDSNDSAANNNESNKPDSNDGVANNNESNKSDSNAAIEALTKTVGELSATVKAIQEANIKGARGKNTNDNNAQSASDVVKNFIKNM